MRRTQSFGCCSCFKSGHTSVEDFEHSSHPSSWTHENVKRVCHVIHAERWHTVNDVLTLWAHCLLCADAFELKV
jgi:hypothetical protein